MTSLAVAAPLRQPRRGIAVATVLAAMTMVVLDAGMTNAALPSLSRAFAVTPSVAIRVVTAYQAGLLVALLPLGALGERWGYRRVFAASVAVFAAAAAAAVLAPSLPWLLAARLLQGLGGAGVMALGVALLRSTVPPARLGAAIGWNALTVALASAAAPSVGAVAMAAGGWRTLYLMDLPVAALALIAARALATTPGRRTASPLLPVDLLRLPAFRFSIIASICCFTAQSCGLIALPFLLQARLQLTSSAAAICLAVWPLSVAVAAAAAGRLADRVPSAWLCALGGGALAVGLFGCGVAPASGGPQALAPFIALCGLGFGLFQTPNNRNLFLAAPAQRGGAAGALQGLARVSGQTLAAVATAMLFSRLPLEAALPLDYGVAATLALVAGLVSLLRAAPAGAHGSQLRS